MQKHPLTSQMIMKYLCNKWIYFGSTLYKRQLVTKSVPLLAINPESYRHQTTQLSYTTEESPEAGTSSSNKLILRLSNENEVVGQNCLDLAFKVKIKCKVSCSSAFQIRE